MAAYLWDDSKPTLISNTTHVTAIQSVLVMIDSASGAHMNIQLGVIAGVKEFGALLR
jgi:hypothetical protein